MRNFQNLEILVFLGSAQNGQISMPPAFVLAEKHGETAARTFQSLAWKVVHLLPPKISSNPTIHECFAKSIPSEKV
jgi:hypothetical protein